MTLPAEFRLLAACCRWPPSPERIAAVRGCAAAIDWDRFAGAVRRHRVEGLAHDALSRAGVAPPARFAERLGADAAATARHNLRFAAEAVRLDRALAAAGTGPLFLKGASLAMLAYGTLGLKRASDIDVAVEPAAYPRACGVLGELGYSCDVPGPAAGQGALAAPFAGSKHTIWSNPPGVVVELHGALVDSPLLLPGLSITAPRQRVALARGLAIPTLADEWLFAYLCVHGATHAWSRLKWLADVAAFLSSREAGEVERLYRFSCAHGGGRSAAQALILAQRLLELRLNPTLARELRGDLRTRAIVALALRTMVRGGAAELDDRLFGTAAIHVSHLFLRPGWRFKTAELRRKFPAGEGRGLSRLAALPRWLGRRARTRAARRT